MALAELAAERVALRRCLSKNAAATKRAGRFFHSFNENRPTTKSPLFTATSETRVRQFTQNRELSNEIMHIT